MFKLETEIMELYEKMGTCNDTEMEMILEEVGDIQSILDSSEFYNLDSTLKCITLFCRKSSQLNI